MKRSVHIVVNANCHQERGWKRWLSIKDEVLRRLPGANIIPTSNATEAGEQLRSLLLADTEPIIISAGGDGSVHFLANLILGMPGVDSTKISLGAIGLGSSNDFLKPFQTLVGKIPVRINTAIQAVHHDAGRVRYIDAEGRWKEKFFIVNASFGVTAEGNWNFNYPGTVLRRLKQINTGAAIAYTAVSTILAHRNKTVWLQYDGVARQAVVSNINILKIPYVSGSLHYKQEILPADGKLGVNICFGMRRHELFQTLIQLEKGRFEPSEKRSSVFTDGFCLKADQPVVFECDGETEMSRHVEISVLPKAICVLNP